MNSQIQDVSLLRSQLENRCSGFFLIYGCVFKATVYGEGGTSRTIFYPFSGVTEELKAFFSDISETSKEQEPRRLSCVEGTRDVAVLGAMLESGARNGAVVPVAKF
ncbi:hypothetical protein F2Q70_00036889 [Brassica cretica]|uniref:Gfo/Idh/MocA-like oxidoreductase C-terminal domain-containing protein n=1 Tax=Brassica cretica TaxID=69181 RepID=A0A8S9K0X1_BRACR|nr:hypothetical protein F2Q70_00036889 [Brassica cretica]